MGQTQTVKRPNIFLQILKSTISNQTAIDSSKDRPWWVALIIAILSVILAAVPIFVSIVSVNGSDYFKTYTYDMDTNLVYMCNNIGADVKFAVKGGELTYTGTGEIFNKDTGDIVKPYERKIQEPGIIGFRAIYLNNYYSEINFDTYLKNYYTRGIEGTTEYLPNFLFLYKDGLRIVVYSAVTDKQTTALVDSGNSYLFKDIKDCNDFIHDWISHDTDGDLSGAKHLSNFKQLLTESFKSTKRVNVLRQTGIYAGVYAGAILLLGLMVFLMTRGKRNPFNYMSFNDGLKISSWASLSPAILALIFGFLMSSSSLGTIFFVLIHGLRIMWLSMNQLRPQ